MALVDQLAVESRYVEAQQRGIFMFAYNRRSIVVITSFLAIIFVSLLIIIGLKIQGLSGKLYACGNIMSPDSASADIELQKGYTAWKNTFVENSYAGSLRVFLPESKRDTVSEAIGYGMII